MQHVQNMQDIRVVEVSKDYTKADSRMTLTMVFGLVGLLVFMPVVFQFIGWAVDKQAVVDCSSYQSQAKEFSTFFLTQSQKAECDSIHMNVDAPVK